MELAQGASRWSTGAWWGFHLRSESWRDQKKPSREQMNTYLASSIALWGTSADAMSAPCYGLDGHLLGRDCSQTVGLDYGINDSEDKWEKRRREGIMKGRQSRGEADVKMGESESGAV